MLRVIAENVDVSIYIHAHPIEKWDEYSDVLSFNKIHNTKTTPQVIFLCELEGIGTSEMSLDPH